ncbi:MAG: hypothetical protein LBK46_05550 [Oscillospiraceae bacterium]|jgi:hypothetical protein|nr:hypothetical protein [Oscillospiraceae bacterium]
MRLSCQDLRNYVIRAPDPAHDDSRYHWLSSPWLITGKVMPTSYSDWRTQDKELLFGEIPERALIMLTEEKQALTTHVGLCVEAADDQPCDYRVTGVQQWPGHVRAYLAYIPENKRG